MSFHEFFKPDEYGHATVEQNLVGALLGIGSLVLLSIIVKKLVWGNLFEKGARVSADLIPPVAKGKVHAILQKFFPYYQSLDEKRKKEFLIRVETFLFIKSFIARGMVKSEEINVLIAATAAQISFGLSSFELFTFNKIIVYPDKYFSEIRGRYHKGEVNVEHGLVVLSANNFLQGIKDPNDGINLGLHEFSHALNIDAYKTRQMSFIQYFDEWQYYAEQEMDRIGKDEIHFLRAYAGTNLQEMFAVCTENFFERPQTFKQELPVLYGCLVKIYQQDPSKAVNPLDLT